MGKYTKYAIGEIVLVVIGILIALQINNWNQDRLAREEEKLILQTIKNDFSNAIIEFNELNKLRTLQINAVRKISEIEPKSIKVEHHPEILRLFSQTLSSPTFNNKAGSLSVLLSSGKINLIKNQELKELLISWPGDVEDMIEDEINSDNLYRDEYLNTLSRYVSLNELFEGFQTSVFRFKRLSLKPLAKKGRVKNDFQGLLSNNFFINVIHHRAYFSMITNMETETLIEKAEQIISIINSELQ